MRISMDLGPRGRGGEGIGGCYVSVLSPPLSPPLWLDLDPWPWSVPPGRRTQGPTPLDSLIIPVGAVQTVTLVLGTKDCE